MKRPLIERLPYRDELRDMLLTFPATKVYQWLIDKYDMKINVRTLQLWRKGIEEGRIMFLDPDRADMIGGEYYIKIRRMIGSKEKRIKNMKDGPKKLQQEKFLFGMYKEMYKIERDLPPVKPRKEKDLESLEGLGPEALEQIEAEIGVESNPGDNGGDSNNRNIERGLKDHDNSRNESI